MIGSRNVQVWRKNMARLAQAAAGGDGPRRGSPADHDLQPVAQADVAQVGPVAGIVVKKVELAGVETAYSVSGMPADAVAFGLKSLGRRRPFDVVVSGANMGSNVGLNAHYSGTVGAAMEAVFLGVPGIAVSQSSSQRDHGIAACFTRRFVWTGPTKRPLPRCASGD